MENVLYSQEALKGPSRLRTQWKWVLTVITRCAKLGARMEARWQHQVYPRAGLLPVMEEPMRF